ncbi:dihydroorotate dehydrogenase [Cystobasidiomycetes sp. EMM_F5]
MARIDLLSIYDSPYTGAVTTRTTTLTGFGHDDTVHQHGFFTSSGIAVKGDPVQPFSRSQLSGEGPISSLNTYGYSPYRLEIYLDWILQLARIDTSEPNTPRLRKPVVISITGSALEVGQLAGQIMSFAQEHALHESLHIEVNLSCPNIAGKPPPAYDGQSLSEYLEVLQRINRPSSMAMGLKLPPYTYAKHFQEVVSALQQFPSIIQFVTSTNTLGSCLMVDSQNRPLLASEAGTGIGGLAGASLHSLALGNVATLKRLFSANGTTRHIQIVGVGGVEDRGGYERMRAAGADYVACATALGAQGVAVFGKLFGL